VAEVHSAKSNAFSDRADGAVVSIYASPKSGKNEIGPVDSGELRVRITAAAVDGAANAALIKYLSDVLKVPRSRIEIASGKKSRHKRVLIQGISSTDLIHLFGSDLRLVPPE
jgi:uncharacterized protein